MKKKIKRLVKKVVCSILASSLLVSSMMLSTFASVELTMDTVYNNKVFTKSFMYNGEPKTMVIYNDFETGTSKITGDMLIPQGRATNYVSSDESEDYFTSYACRHIEGYQTLPYIITDVEVSCSDTYQNILFLTDTGNAFSYDKSFSHGDIKKIEGNFAFYANNLIDTVSHKNIYMPEYENIIDDFEVIYDNVHVNTDKEVNNRLERDYLVKITLKDGNVLNLRNGSFENSVFVKKDGNSISVQAKSNSVKLSSVCITNTETNDIKYVNALTKSGDEYIYDISLSIKEDVIGEETKVTFTSTNELTFNQDNTITCGNLLVKFETLGTYHTFADEIKFNNPTDFGFEKYDLYYVSNGVYKGFEATAYGAKADFTIENTDKYIFGVCDDVGNLKGYYALDFSTNHVDKGVYTSLYNDEIDEIVDSTFTFKSEDDGTFIFSYDGTNINISIIPEEKEQVILSLTSGLEFTTENVKNASIIKNIKVGKTTITGCTKSDELNLLKNSVFTFDDTTYPTSALDTNIICLERNNGKLYFVNSDYRAFEVIYSYNNYFIKEITPSGVDIIKINSFGEMLSVNGDVYDVNGTKEYSDVYNLYNGYRALSDGNIYNEDNEMFLVNYATDYNFNTEMTYNSVDKVEYELTFDENIVNVVAPDGSTVVNGQTYTFTKNGYYIFDITNSYNDKFKKIIIVADIGKEKIENPIVSVVNNKVSLKSDNTVLISLDNENYSVNKDAFDYEKPFYIKAQKQNSYSMTQKVTINNGQVVVEDVTEEVIDSDNFLGKGYISSDGDLIGLDGETIGHNATCGYVYSEDYYTYYSVSDSGYEGFSTSTELSVYGDSYSTSNGWNNPIAMFFNGLHDFIVGDNGSVSKISGSATRFESCSGIMNYQWYDTFLGDGLESITPDEDGAINYGEESIDTTYNADLDLSANDVKYIGDIQKNLVKHLGVVGVDKTTVDEESFYDLNGEWEELEVTEEDCYVHVICNSSDKDETSFYIYDNYHDSVDAVKETYDKDTYRKELVYPIKAGVQYEIRGQYIYDISIYNYTYTEINPVITNIRPTDNGFTSLSDDGYIYSYDEELKAMINTNKKALNQLYQLDYTISDTNWTNSGINVEISQSETSNEYSTDKIMENDGTYNYFEITPYDFDYQFSINEENTNFEYKIYASYQNYEFSSDNFLRLNNLTLNESCTPRYFDDAGNEITDYDFQYDTWYTLKFTLSEGDYKLSGNGWEDVRICNDLVVGDNKEYLINEFAPFSVLDKNDNYCITTYDVDTDTYNTEIPKNGIYTVVGVDSKKNINYTTKFSVENIDTVAPIVSLSAFNSNGAKFDSEDVEDSISAISGIDKMFYSIDNNIFYELDSSKTIKYDKNITSITEDTSCVNIPTKTVFIYATDKAGNNSEVKEFDISLSLNYDIKYNNGLTDLTFYADEDINHSNSDYTYSYSFETTNENGYSAVFEEDTIATIKVDKSDNGVLKHTEMDVPIKVIKTDAPEITNNEENVIINKGDIENGILKNLNVKVDSGEYIPYTDLPVNIKLTVGEHTIYAYQTVTLSDNNDVSISSEVTKKVIIVTEDEIIIEDPVILDEDEAIDTPTDDNTPQTGDSNPIWYLILGFGLFSLIFIYVSIISKKNKSKETEK